MDWFERLTGISPDGGNGSFEIFLATLPAVFGALIMAFALRLTRKRKG